MSKFKNVKATCVNNIEDWRKFLSDNISKNWATSTDKEILDLWGIPNFPCFAFVTDKDSDRGMLNDIYVVYDKRGTDADP